MPLNNTNTTILNNQGVKKQFKNKLIDNQAITK